MARIPNREFAASNADQRRQQLNLSTMELARRAQVPYHRLYLSFADHALAPTEALRVLRALRAAEEELAQVPDDEDRSSTG